MPITLPNRVSELTKLWNIPESYLINLQVFFTEHETAQKIIDLIPIQYMLPTEICITQAIAGVSVTKVQTNSALDKIGYGIYRDILKYDEVASPLETLFVGASIVRNVAPLNLDTQKTLSEEINKINNGIKLIEAVKDCNLLDVEKLLLNQDVKLTIANHRDENAVYLAAERNNHKILELLLEHPIICVNNAEKLVQFAPLHIAVHHNFKDVTKMLLDKGANIDQQNNKGETALFIALHRNYRDMPKILLEHGADPSKANNEGESPLHIALKHNSFPDVLQLLLDHPKTNIDQANQKGDTALHIVFQRSSNGIKPEDMLKMLLDKGVDVDQPNKEGKTALYLALKYICSEDAVKVLLNKGAKVTDEMVQMLDGSLNYSYNSYKVKSIITKHFEHQNIQQQSLLAPDQQTEEETKMDIIGSSVLMTGDKFEADYEQ